jgi:hypothetical protein
MRRAGRLLSWLGRLAADRSGASALMTTLMLPVLLGFTALAVDGGMAYVSKRDLQNAADSAAYSTAAAIANGFTNLSVQARAVTREYGLVHGQGGVLVNVWSPARSGPHASNPKSVEVEITRPMLTFFSSLFGASAGTIRARAVSLAGANGRECVLLLHPTATWSMLINGSPDLEMDDCTLQVNSNAAQAMLVNGSGRLAAKSIVLGGGYFVNGTPSINVADGIQTNKPPLADPYAGTPVPSGPCNYNNFTFPSSNLTLPTPSPVLVFCGTTSMAASPNYNFPPGIYVFTGDLLISGSPRINADGATFVLSGAASLTISGSPDLRLSAPAAGPTAGFAFLSSSTATDATFNGTSSSAITGLMYFPKQKVTLNGSNMIAGNCVMMIARELVVNGSSEFGISCGDLPLKPFGRIASRLVE